MAILEGLKYGTTHSLPFSLRHVAECQHTKLLPPQLHGSQRFGVMSVPTLRPLQKNSETLNISNDTFFFHTSEIRVRNFYAV
jgi:hypothetical protein